MKKRRDKDVSFTAFGWWIRLIWGVTMSYQHRTKHIRWHKFYGYRLLALQFGDPMSERGARLVGVQWRRA